MAEKESADRQFGGRRPASQCSRTGTPTNEGRALPRDAIWGDRVRNSARMVAQRTTMDMLTGPASTQGHQGDSGARGEQAAEGAGSAMVQLMLRRERGGDRDGGRGDRNKRTLSSREAEPEPEPKKPPKRPAQTDSLEQGKTKRTKRGTKEPESGQRIGERMAEEVFDALTSTGALDQEIRSEFDDKALMAEQRAALEALGNKEYAHLFDRNVTTYVRFNGRGFVQKASPGSTGLEDTKQPQKSFLLTGQKPGALSSTVMHEYYHSLQDPEMDETSAETDAHLKESLWRRKRGLAVEKDYLAKGEISEDKIRKVQEPITRGQEAQGREFVEFKKNPAQVLLAGGEGDDWVSAEKHDWGEFNLFEPVEGGDEANIRSDAFLQRLRSLLGEEKGESSEGK